MCLVTGGRVVGEETVFRDFWAWFTTVTSWKAGPSILETWRQVRTVGEAVRERKPVNI